MSRPRLPTVRTHGTRETPVCPTHGHPLTLLEEGDLNGTTVRYWGQCLGNRVVCAYHADRGEHDPADQCVCHVSPCYREVRTTDAADEPTLPLGDA